MANLENYIYEYWQVQEIAIPYSEKKKAIEYANKHLETVCKIFNREQRSPHILSWINKGLEG